MGFHKIAVAVACLTLMLQTHPDTLFKDPFRVNVGEEPISVDEGRASPFFSDFDGDGLRDLIVGQVADGKMRIYRNIGTLEAPVFNNFEYLQAAGFDATVPIG